MSDFEKLIEDAAASPGVDALDVRIAKAAYAAGAAAEREACAKVASEFARRYADYALDDRDLEEAHSAAREACNAVVFSICARGEDKTNG